MSDENPPSDRTLVETALKERNAFAFIVRRYEAPIRRYVARIMGRSAAEADDVVQEAFIKIYLNLRNYDCDRPFTPWAYRIAHNEAIAMLRKRRNSVFDIGGEDGALLLQRIQSDTGVKEIAAQNRIVESMRLAVAALQPRYRDVIVLRYLEEKSYEEISDILHLSPGTVATLISRAKQRLRAAMGEEMSSPAFDVWAQS